MKIFSLFLLLSCFSGWVSAQSSENTSRDIYLADPTIFYEDGTYYLYGTGGDSDYGFQVFTSTDLKHWSGPGGASFGYALKKGDSFGSRGFWAPQVFRYKGKYRMAYTADEFIAIAESDSPLGPFIQKTIARLPSTLRQIDPFVFFDEDGKIYLYHVRLSEGNRLFVAELNEDLSSIKENTLKECISAQTGWENTAKAEWPVSEGPTVIKRNGKYYFFYSANDFRNKDYAVGYAVADSPYGPWAKYEGNPILSRSALKRNGTGHGDLFLDARGTLRYVFHTHYDDREVGPRRTAVITMKETVEGSGLKYQVLPETVDFLQVSE